jgi:5-methylcytosine-specific restriction enzyme subunit McrC
MDYLVVYMRIPLNLLASSRAYKLESFNILEGEIQIQSIQDLYERIANILSKNILNKIRKGLYKNYLKYEEDLTHLRGKIQTIPTTKNIMTGKLNLRCEYEEHTADFEDNQILLWALYESRKLELKRNEVKKNVRRAYRELSNKLALTEIKSMHKQILPSAQPRL